MPPIVKFKNFSYVKGPKRDTGPKGDKGDRGPKGDVGEAGPRGPKGDDASLPNINEIIANSTLDGGSY